MGTAKGRDELMALLRSMPRSPRIRPLLDQLVLTLVAAGSRGGEPAGARSIGETWHESVAP